MLHRPMWHADWLGVGDALVPPAGIAERPGIWISYVTEAAVDGDLTALTVLRSHRCVAVGEFTFESAKIGGGTATDQGPGRMAANPPWRRR